MADGEGFLPALNHNRDNRERGDPGRNQPVTCLALTGGEFVGLIATNKFGTKNLTGPERRTGTCPPRSCRSGSLPAHSGASGPAISEGTPPGQDAIFFVHGDPPSAFQGVSLSGFPLSNVRGSLPHRLIFFQAADAQPVWTGIGAPGPGGAAPAYETHQAACHPVPRPGARRRR